MPTGFTHRFKGKIALTQPSVDKFGKGSVSFPLSGQIFTYASATGISNGADTTEDVLQSFTLPANCFDQVGRGLQIIAFGSIAATSATKTARLYFGASSISAQYTTTNTGGWYLEMNVMKAGSNSQVISTQSITTAHGGVTTVIGSEVDNSGIIIKVTGQSSVSTAGLVTVNSVSVFAMN